MKYNFSITIIHTTLNSNYISVTNAMKVEQTQLHHHYTATLVTSQLQPSSLPLAIKFTHFHFHQTSDTNLHLCLIHTPPATSVDFNYASEI